MSSEADNMFKPWLEPPFEIISPEKQKKLYENYKSYMTVLRRIHELNVQLNNEDPDDEDSQKQIKLDLEETKKLTKPLNDEIAKLLPETDKTYLFLVASDIGRQYARELLDRAMSRALDGVYRSPV